MTQTAPHTKAYFINLTNDGHNSNHNSLKGQKVLKNMKWMMKCQKEKKQDRNEIQIYIIICTFKVIKD